MNRTPSSPAVFSRHQSKMWFGILRWFILIVVVSYVYQSLQRGIADLQLRGMDWRQIRIDYLIFAGLFYILAQIPSAFFWRRLIVVMGQRPRFYDAWRAYFIGHLGKYVPGKLAVVAIRGGLIKTEDVHVGIASLSVFVETFTMMIVGTVLASLVLLTYPQTELLRKLQLAAVLVIVGMLPTISPPVIRMVARLALRWQRDRRLDGWLASLKFSHMIEGFFLSTLTWSLMTISFACAAYSLPMETRFPETLADWLSSLCAICMSVVAGFVSMMPGGLGVREWVGDQLLTPRIGSAYAIISVTLLRLAWLAAELGLSCVLYFLPPGDSTSQGKTDSLG